MARDPRRDDDDDDTVDREAETPKVSGSRDRWPMFRDVAQRLFDAATHEAWQCEKVIEKISYARAGALRRVARQARLLVDAFEHWESGDPGDDLRRAAIAKLYDLREEARQNGVDLL